jgi:hypothetical protein
MRLGVFCPTAAVLCWPCHGRQMPRWRDGKVVNKEIPQHTWDFLIDEGFTAHPESDYYAAKCDKCKCDIAVERQDVAELQKLGRESGLPFNMDQTGGMCCAVKINGPKFTYYVTAEDGYFITYWPKDWSDEQVDELMQSSNPPTIKGDMIWSYEDALANLKKHVQENA